MFFGDVITIGCSITPFNFNSVTLINKTINFKSLGALTESVWYSNGARVWESLEETKFGRLFKKGAGVFVKKSSLVLVNVYQFSFVSRDSKDAIYQIVPIVVVFHFSYTSIHADFQVCSILIRQFTYLGFDGHDG